MAGDATEALLERWRTGRDTAALGELLKAQRDRAYATAYRILGHGFDAEDAVQNAFVKLLSRTQGFENAQEFQRSVYRAVVQCAIDQTRHRQRRQQRVEAMSRNNEEPSNPPELEAAEREEARACLRGALLRLTEEDRAAVVLCCQQGLPLGEAAAVLEVPRQTLRDRLARTLQRLREDLTRAGIALSVTALAAQLAQESALQAPASLCSKLDGALPGKACANVPTQPPLPPDPSVWTMTGGSVALKAVGVAVLTTVALVALLALALQGGGSRAVEQSVEAAPKAAANVKAPVVEPDRAAPEHLHPENTQSERGTDMDRKTLAGLTLTAALLAAPLASAGEKDDVEAVLKDIRARKAEKAAAAEKARKDTESGNPVGGFGWGRGNPGGNPGQPQGGR
ncbi:MAG: RNA polymerase sigma factor [Planctomycetes bacterium]|nr:RNA polymerase sigma factor [Planctomycetota bacterium]